jgi:hypothetical protein
MAKVRNVPPLPVMRSNQQELRRTANLRAVGPEKTWDWEKKKRNQPNGLTRVKPLTFTFLKPTFRVSARNKCTLNGFRQNDLGRNIFDIREGTKFTPSVLRNLCCGEGASQTRRFPNGL